MVVFTQAARAVGVPLVEAAAPLEAAEAQEVGDVLIANRFTKRTWVGLLVPVSTISTASLRL